jgi:superfamily II DNA or RNA helicase
MVYTNRNLAYIKNEIYDIVKAVKDGEPDTIILDSYENYSKAMLESIKIKDKMWFTLLFDSIARDIKDGVGCEALKDDYATQQNGKQLLSYIIDTIFNKEEKQIEYDDEEEDEDIENKEEIEEQLNDIKIEEAVQNFEWRKNQLDAIKNTLEQNFSCGVHNQIMGAGKTFIILNTIWEHFKLNPSNKKMYVITCFRQEILKDLFFDEEGLIDDDKEDFFRRNDIIDLDKFKIINKIHTKDRILKLSKNKPSILVINTDYLKCIDKGDNIIDYDDLNFVILDECHSVSAQKFYSLLKKIKYTNQVSIIGFSATPLRDGAGNKLIDIFSKTKNDKDINKKLNIISNYDFINAIKDNVILPPYYILCEINKTLNGKIGKSNKDITKRVLENTLKIAPYKKVIGWCRSKEHLKEYYKFIKENFPDLSLYCSSCFDDELKQLGYNTNWNEFTRKKNNAILLCINRGREGSDIKNLDTAMYLDAVKKRSLLVALQTSGRVLRRDTNGRKTHGLIIDTFVNVDGIQIEQMTAKKIIAYYKNIFSLCDEKEHVDQKQMYEKMIDICNNINYDEKKEEITIKLSDKDDKHNMKFKLELTTKSYDFNKFKIEISTIIEKMYNVDKKQKFDTIVDKLKKTNWFDIDTVDFKEAYDALPNKDKMGIPMTLKELYTEYKDFIDSKLWYDYLDIDTSSWHQSINECYKALKKIYNTEIDDRIYQKACLKDKRIPVNPYEFYKLQGFKSIKEAFNKDNNAKSMIC